MSTDSALPEPDDTGISGQSPEVPPAPEPFLAELADDEEPPIRLRRRRPARPLRPPGPPQPGFWTALGLCLLLLFLTQLVVPLGIGLLIVVAQIIRLGGLQAAMDWLKDNQTGPAFLVPLQMSAHVAIFVMALLCLRLAAGKTWPRQVAIRAPAVGHVLLALVGAPAFWLLGNGLQLLGSHVLPSLYDLPSLVAVIVLLILGAGACLLLLRLVTGHDLVRALAAAPLRVQVVVGPLVVLWLLGTGVGLYWLVSPHIFRIPEFPELGPDVLEKSVESLLQVPWWGAMLVIAVTPAFSEEFWCRAFLGRGLVGRQGYVLGIVWTSVFFGSIHVFPQQAAMAAILGVVLHSAYVASRSLLIPMLMHYLNNSMAVVAYKFLGNLSPRLQIIETAPQQIPWVWYAAAVFLAAAVLWAFYASRARLVRIDGSGEPPWQPPFAGVAHPPPDSGTAVVYPWPGALPALAVVAGAAALGCALYFA
jgi:membrane protease YdiL (CAAX protease family)